MYLWEKPDWPAFTWDEKALAKLLAQVSREQGRLLGKMEALGFDLRNEAHLRTLTEDVVKSSEIEGEKLERDQVRSSIARRLGMDVGGLIPADRDVEGVVEMMLDATGNYAEAPHRRTAVRLARCPVPDRPQRHAQNPGRCTGVMTVPARWKWFQERLAKRRCTIKRRPPNAFRMKWQNS